MAIDPTIVRDVVVVIPGIMGSELVDAENQPVWSVSPGGLINAIRTLGRSITRLELPRGIGDEAPDDGVRATALFRSLHVVPGLWSPVIGYDGLVKFLQSSRFHLIESSTGNGTPPNLLPFPYDWRLSNRYNGRLLAKVALDALERWRAQPGMRDAKLVLVCHSMGGLVARWFAEREGGAECIRRIITIGTPHRGALKSLDTLANGVPCVGRLRVKMTNFVRSLPSLYQLLPTYNCLVTDSGRVGLRGADCPELNTEMLDDAMEFHSAINSSRDAPYALHKVAGIRQPTLTTARISGRSVVASNEIDGKNQGGDGTVPRLAAEPEHGRGQEVYETANQHGELQGTRSLLDLVDGILTREEIVWQAAAPDGFGVAMAEVWSTHDTPHLRVTEANDRRFSVTLADEVGRAVAPPTPVSADGTASFGQLPEGAYRAVITTSRRTVGPTVTKAFVVLDPAKE